MVSARSPTGDRMLARCCSNASNASRAETRSAKGPAESSSWAARFDGHGLSWAGDPQKIPVEVGGCVRVLGLELCEHPGNAVLAAVRNRAQVIVHDGVLELNTQFSQGVVGLDAAFEVGDDGFDIALAGGLCRACGRFGRGRLVRS